MEKILSDLHLLKHPFYRDWMEGKLTRAQLRDYAAQYQHHVDAFPRYLGAIHSNCENIEARKIILENLNDEEGVTHGTAHPELWRKFARGLGGSTEERSQYSAPREAIKNVVDTFFGCARSTMAEGLGALYAYEAQVPEIAESKIEGLKSRYGISDAATLSFFEAHRTADVYHREAIKKIIDALPESEKALATAAAEKAARALWDFLSDVHGRNHSAAA